MAYHSAQSLKVELRALLGDTRELSQRLQRLIDATGDYDLQRQLKKIDAELLDVQHNINLALEQPVKPHDGK